MSIPTYLIAGSSLLLLLMSPLLAKSSPIGAPDPQIYFPDSKPEGKGSYLQHFERPGNPLYNFKFNFEDYTPLETKAYKDVILFPVIGKHSQPSSTGASNDYSIISHGGGKLGRISPFGSGKNLKSLGVTRPPLNLPEVGPESLEQIEAFEAWIQKQKEDEDPASPPSDGDSKEETSTLKDYSLANPIKSLNCPDGSKLVGGNCRRGGGGFS